MGPPIPFAAKHLSTSQRWLESKINCYAERILACNVSIPCPTLNTRRLV
jgi:hypothetical protein